MEKEKDDSKKRISNSFFTGVIALVFLIIGYQTALFIQRAAVAHILANKDHPDTVYIYADPDAGTELALELERFTTALDAGRVQRYGDDLDGGHGSGRDSGAGCGPATIGKASATHHKPVRVNSDHSRQVMTVRQKYSPRRYESFRFNPNTASVEELQQLGFSLKQAQSIDNYRNKGGKFRRKEDFAKSFVVADSVYHRLESYIDIPKLDINFADSAAFDALPGIGGYFAAKMVAYRKALHGYSCKEQLMDIKYFDEEKFHGLEDLITVSRPDPYPMWTLPADSLYRHPYIRSAARSIVLYRENNPQSAWHLEGLLKATVISETAYHQLSRCRIASPSL